MSAEVSEVAALFTINSGNSMAITSGGIMSASTVSATTFSGSVATSAGGTDFAFTAKGKWAGDATSQMSAVSADRMLRFTVGGVNYYVPAASGVLSG